MRKAVAPVTKSASSCLTLGKTRASEPARATLRSSSQGSVEFTVEIERWSYAIGDTAGGRAAFPIHLLGDRKWKKLPSTST